MEGDDVMSVNFNPAYARGAWIEVRYDGEDIGISKLIESLSYTDNASGALDDITLTLDNTNEISWVPEKGKDLDVTIHLENWFVNGKEETYHCGNFCIDDLTYSGSPSQLKVKAVSQPAGGSIKETKKTRTFKMVTLKQIAEAIMAEHGMTKLYYNADEIMMESIEQSDKPDSEFLSELCKKYGLCLKTYKVGFVIYDELQYESMAPKTFFGKYPKNTAYNTNAGFEDWPMHEIQPNWTWNTTLQHTYTGAQLKYTDAKGGKDYDVVIGTPERLLTINEKADSLADAQRIAASKINEENKKQVSMSFSPTLFQPYLFASNTIEIVNLGRPDGKYMVDKVSVSMSGSGVTESVTLHKCMPKFDAMGVVQQTEIQKQTTKQSRTAGS